MRTISSLILAPDAESHLLAALLVLNAVVTVQNPDARRRIPLPEFLDNGEAALAGVLVTAVTLETSGKMAMARAARTPADKPIVAAVARRLPDGSIRLALSGVGTLPGLVEPEMLGDLNPPGDFRGSTAYRRDMANVLSQRVLDELEAS